MALSTEVANLAKELPDAKAEAVANDLSTLTSEALASAPRRKIYEVSAEGLMEAAKTVAGMAEPITRAVKVVLALLT
jgi:hypothetical protein